MYGTTEDGALLGGGGARGGGADEVRRPRAYDEVVTPSYGRGRRVRQAGEHEH